MNAPIAIFVYRRCDHLAAMLDTLARCNGIGDSSVTVFSDGPRGDQDRDDVLAVRELVAGLGWSNLQVVHSETNKGLRRSIIEGVTRVTSLHGRVIVLEDDLHLSPLALEYFNAALDRYADEARVWSVCGYMYDVPRFRGRDSAFFLPYAHPWGWATWARAWSRADFGLTASDALLSSRSFRDAFNANGIADYAGMLALAQQGLIDSWFVRWYFNIFMHGGLSLFPPRSYVRNIGIGGAGATHGSRLNPYTWLVPPPAVTIRETVLPESVEPDYASFDEIPRAWDTRVQRNIIRAGQFKRSTRAVLRGARARNGGG